MARTQMRVGLVLLATTVFLAGCIVMRAEKASRAKEEMIGMSKSRILACMCVPASRATEGSVAVWSYNSGGDSKTVGSGMATASGGSVYGFGASKTLQRYCVISVVFQGGRVSAVNYSGRTGGLLTGGEQCAFAVENCIQ